MQLLVLFVGVAAAFVPAAAFGPRPACNATACNILQLAKRNPDLSTFVLALEASGLADAIASSDKPAPFTVFAPVNEAFKKLPYGTLARLLLNKKALAALLTYHVIGGARIEFEDLAKPSVNYVKTLQGDILTAVRHCTDRKCGRSKLSLNPFDGYEGRYEASIKTRDLGATNGVVHTIDSVLRQANHLYFRVLIPLGGPNGVGDRCGEVDASTHMPVALFDPENAAQLKRYADVTVGLYPSTYFNGGKLALGRCKDIGYTVTDPRGPTYPNWSPPELMKPICKERCNCTYTGQGYPPDCPDVPDNSTAGTFCSLCGPMFNTGSFAGGSKVYRFDKSQPKPPTSGCTKTSCPFSFTNPTNVNGGRCGEVDAAARMPDDIWSDSNAVDEYVAATVALYNIAGAKLVNSLCDRTGRTQNGSVVASWTSPDLMSSTCQAKCLCKYPCVDQPDEPFPLHRYCSLCGPKYNQPIEVNLWVSTAPDAGGVIIQNTAPKSV